MDGSMAAVQFFTSPSRFLHFPSRSFAIPGEHLLRRSPRPSPGVRRHSAGPAAAAAARLTTPSPAAVPLGSASGAAGTRRGRGEAGW